MFFIRREQSEYEKYILKTSYMQENVWKTDISAHFVLKG